jgi:hypothetical protein
MSETIPVVLIVAIPSALVAITTLIMTHIKEKRNSSLQIVTNQRIGWLEILRNEIADYITLTQKCFYCGVLQKGIATLDEGKKFLDISSETVALGYKLILRLNPNENRSLIETIKILNKSVSGNEIKVESEEFMQNINGLVTESHNVLKQEWEKVKEEAGYKKPATIRGGG